MKKQKKSLFKIPILFIIFNRPEETNKVFSIIKKIRPKYLYISADYPKNDSDLNKSIEAKKIINDIDWDCELKTNFSEKPLGCKIGVSSAINWLFMNEEQGIILEDDCYPSQDFFRFCELLLKKYENDPHIMSISGFNPLNKYSNTEYSYLFSYYGSIWGWATWKRAWDKYELNMDSWNKKESQKIVRKNLKSNIQYYFRKKSFDLSYKKLIDTWDYAWSYSRIVNSGLSIVPEVSLVENIGFGNNATHTKSILNPYSNISGKKIKFPLNHPNHILVNRDFDKKYFLKLAIKSRIYSIINLPILLLRRIK